MEVTYITEELEISKELMDFLGFVNARGLIYINKSKLVLGEKIVDLVVCSWRRKGRCRNISDEILKIYLYFWNSKSLV